MTSTRRSSAAAETSVGGAIAANPSVLDHDVEGAVETGSGIEDAAAVEDRSGHATLLSWAADASIEPARHTGRDRTQHREAA